MASLHRQGERPNVQIEGRAAFGASLSNEVLGHEA